MGKKSKRSSLERYLYASSGKPWKSKSDYKDSKKHWNNGPRKQRNPAGYDSFKNREAAYKDRKAEEKARKASERKSGGRASSRGPDTSGYFDANRGSGEYKDIKNALRSDTQLGFDTAEELRNRGISTSNSSTGLTYDLQRMRAGGLSNSRSTSPYESMNFTDDQRRIAQLIGIRSLDSQNDLDQVNRLQQGAAAIGLRNLDSQNDLAKIEQYYAENPNAWTPTGRDPNEQPGGQMVDGYQITNPIADYIPQSDPFADQMAELQAAYNNQLAQLQSQQSYFNQQLQTANAARVEAENRANNMRNAFVPQANPTALSAAYGDERTSSRQRSDNQLSDLSILSGLGTTSNPLAGLQLA